ncbi:hypothetical protein F4677DRAFT_271288 [Hypoxylon crocopeplum]|nr:hypothetical protein F4677DRAFT_271288 [Hypoxylon crocopeplum]
MGRSGYETTHLWSAEESETPYSICSADTPEVEEDHLLFELKDSFLQMAMAAYMQAGGRKLNCDHIQEIESTETPFEQVDGEGDASARPRKRGRLSDNASTTTGEKQSQRALPRRRQQDRRLWLACPFAKKDPVQYRSCYGYFLGRVRDVKQHLTRCHRKPIYCPVCNETFEDEDEKDSHIRARSCTPRPSVVIEGISEKQKRELSHRVSSKMPEDQQWFAVFDTLFFPHPRPRTPYRDRELSEDLCVFQDFMSVRGPVLLAELLEARGMITSNLPHEERDLAAFKEEVLGEGMQLIIDQWMNDTATAGQRSVAHSRRSSPTVDSGIAMGNDHPQSSQSVYERRMASDSFYVGPTSSCLTDEKHEGDENRGVLDVFSRTRNSELGTSTFQTDDGRNHYSQSVTDNARKNPEDVSINSNQNHALEADPLIVSQFTALQDYSGSMILPAIIEDSDLLSFDMDWPP